MRIAIRPWAWEDAPYLAKAFNNQKAQDNLRDGIPFPYTEEDALDAIETAAIQPVGSRYSFSVLLDGAPVGSIGFARGSNIHRRIAEVGYCLAEEHWSKGIMTNALRLACEELFQNTNLLRIFAQPFSDNIASCKVLEKSGFILEGTLRQNAIKRGTVMDMKLYARLKEGP